MVIGLFIALAGIALAEEVTTVYEASVPVENQDQDKRTEAIRTAFTQVLTRISGRSDIADQRQFPAIASAIASATRYAQQFRYVKTTPTAPAQQSGLELWVRFDETAIGQLLRDNHLPVWGMTRPATLLWLVVDNRGQRELLGADSRNDTYTTLADRAKLRGVPLRLPLLDLTDRNALHVSDVWGNFESAILQASQRYQTQAVLVGRVFQSSGNSWTGRWTLYVEGSREDWTVTANSLADVLNPGIDKTAEILAVHYAAIVQEDTRSVVVEVKAIRGLADYNRVVKYLSSIAQVSSVQTIELSAESAIFRVTIPGGRLAVARAVALGRVLAAEPVSSVPVASTPVTPGKEGANAVPGLMLADLYYRLVP